MLPRQSREVQGGVEARLPEIVVAAKRPARVLDAPLQPAPAGGPEEVVPRVDGVDARQAARRADGAIDGQPDRGRLQIDCLEAVGDIEPGEVPENPPSSPETPPPTWISFLFDSVPWSSTFTFPVSPSGFTTGSSPT